MSRFVRQVTITDENTGEVVHDSLSRGSQLGRGWCAMYSERVKDLLLQCPSAATLKVFLLLATGQQFDEKGMITTKKAVQDTLGITKQTCLEAFKWLKAHFIINEYKVNGYTEFMVNPELVMVGRDKKKRQAEWIRRWANQTVSVQSASGPVAALPKPKKPKRSID